MPEKTPIKPKVPTVDLFNDNDFDSFIQKIEKKPVQKIEPPRQTKTEIKVEKKVAPKITNLFDDEPDTDYFDELLKNKVQSKAVKITSENLKKPSFSTGNKDTSVKKGLFDEDLEESGSDLSTVNLFNEPPKQKNLFENSITKRAAFEDLFSSKSDNLFDDKSSKPVKKLENNEVSKVLATERPLTSNNTTIISHTEELKTEKKQNLPSNIFKPTLPLFDENSDDIFNVPQTDIFDKSELKKSSLFDDLQTLEAPKVKEDQSPPADSRSDFLSSPESKNVSAMFLDDEPPEDLNDWGTEADGDSDDSKPSFAVANQSALSFSSSLQLFDDLPPPDDFDNLFSKSNKQSISSKMFFDYDEDDTTNSPRTSSLSSLSSPIGILSDEPPPDDEIDNSIRRKMDLFKNIAAVDKPEEIREKISPKRLNMNFNVVADQTEEIKAKPSPKKLNMNFNINVNALLPGARPPLNIASNIEPDAPKLIEANESSSSMEESVNNIHINYI